MAALISVSEHNLIGSDHDFPESAPDIVVVPDPVFRALRRVAFDTDGADALLTVVVQRKREVIRVRNYAGLLMLSDGTQLEILPKITAGHDPRLVLLTMLRHLRNGPFRVFDAAHTRPAHLPLWDVFVKAFLDALAQLMRPGLQRAYVPVETNERFWKGTFQATRQQRENAHHAERLSVRYDTLTADIPPNRILKTTLLYLNQQRIDSANRTRIGQLTGAFNDVPVSASLADDRLAIARMSRLFARYEPALRWAEALLDGRAFGVQKGHTASLSLLFPMERVFEDYVAHGIRTHWPGTDRVTVQESSAHLVDEHGGTPRFKLRPDIIIRQPGRTLVMDTKWKSISGSGPGMTPGSGSYGIDQADLYQLYAYGKKYAATDLFLIYPASDTFRQPLPVFAYDATTRLHVVPLTRPAHWPVK